MGFVRPHLGRLHTERFEPGLDLGLTKRRRRKSIYIYIYIHKNQQQVPTSNGGNGGKGRSNLLIGHLCWSEMRLFLVDGR